MPNLPVIESALLSALPHIKHGFFTKQGGVSGGIYDSLNCGEGSSDEPEKIKQNRSLVAAHLNADYLLSGAQTHSTSIAMITSAAPYEADGAITKTKGLALGVLTADCAPLLLADRSAPLVAAVHAGWRGAVAGISDEAIKQMAQRGARNIVCAIGPAIGFSLYEVGSDMRDACLVLDEKTERFFTPHKSDKFRFNLSGYIQARLEQLGVEAQVLDHCTLSQPDRFFSSRYNKQANISDYGRQISAIILR